LRRPGTTPPRTRNANAAQGRREPASSRARRGSEACAFRTCASGRRSRNSAVELSGLFAPVEDRQYVRAEVVARLRPECPDFRITFDVAPFTDARSRNAAGRLASGGRHGCRCPSNGRTGAWDGRGLTGRPARLGARNVPELSAAGKAANATMTLAGVKAFGQASGCISFRIRVRSDRLIERSLLLRSTRSISRTEAMGQKAVHLLGFVDCAAPIVINSLSAPSQRGGKRQGAATRVHFDASKESVGDEDGRA
jgi:hypothetical protein